MFKHLHIKIFFDTLDWGKAVSVTINENVN